MDSNHAVKVLREHNEWRRGNRLETWDRMPYSPAELGAAIDSVCAALSERDRMLGEAVVTLQELCDTLGECGMTDKARAFLSAYDASKKESAAEIFPGTREALNRLAISGGKNE